MQCQKKQSTVAHSSGREFLGKEVAKYFTTGGWAFGTVMNVVAGPGGKNTYKIGFRSARATYHEVISGAEAGQAIEIAKRMRLHESQTAKQSANASC